MTHARRPVPAKRLYTDWPYYPTPESDGEPHCGEMLDLRSLRIHGARQNALHSLESASACREHAFWWCFYMRRAAENRKLLAGLLRSGGRVDWRGEPVQENV